MLVLRFFTVVISIALILTILPSFSAENVPILSKPHLLFVKVQFDDVDGGEFFSIYNSAKYSVDISNWSITDGEGALLFLNGSIIQHSSEFVIAQNFQSYLRQNGKTPDYSILDKIGKSCAIRSSGTFRLSNEGDELILKDPNQTIIDCLAFGSNSDVVCLSNSWKGECVPSPGRGCIIQRQFDVDSFIDSDSKFDWTSLRVYRPGQSTFSPFHCNAIVTPLILPEHSNIIIDSILSAKKRVRICTYEFDSLAFSESLLEIARDGVQIEILIEGSPVGGLKDESATLLNHLSQKGAKIVLMKSPASGESIRRYPCLHAKYLIIDDRICFAMSENIVTDVFDVSLGKGNRGWGLKFESSYAAQYLNEIFNIDSNSAFSDIVSLSSNIESLQSNPDLEDSNFIPARIVPAPPEIECPIKIFAFPDYSDTKTGIEKILDLSKESLLTELFYADLIWKTPLNGNFMNPIISAVIEKTKFLDEFIFCIDGSWISSQNGKNSELLNEFSRNGISNTSDWYVGYQNVSAPFNVIHNKGFLIDHRYSCISSVNWCFESVCSNRELAVLIDNLHIADFFENCLRRDIFGENNPPEIIPEFSFSDVENGLRLTLSENSDESGLKEVSFRSANGSLSNWYIEIDFNNPPDYVDIHAVDLWGNHADTRIILFPREENPASFQMELGSIVSAGSLMGISYTLISSLIIWLKRKKADNSIINSFKFRFE